MEVKKTKKYHWWIYWFSGLVYVCNHPLSNSGIGVTHEWSSTRCDENSIKFSYRDYAWMKAEETLW